MVLILSPVVNGDARSCTRGVLVAGRVAVLSGLIPLSPLVNYKPFMTEDEFDRGEPELAMVLYKRCSRIWLCARAEDLEGGLELDRATFKVLTDNEGSFLRGGRREQPNVPVFAFAVDAPELGAYPVTRSDVRGIISCNVTRNLFIGGADEEDNGNRA